MLKLRQILVLLAMISSQSLAGIVDLQLEIAIEDTNNLTFGQIVPFTLTVTNHGPDDAAASSTAFLPNRIFTNNIFTNSSGYDDVVLYQDSSVEQECFFVIVYLEPIPLPGFPPASVAYIINMPIIPANSAINCYGLVQVFFEGSYKLIFRSSAIPTDTDTDLTNNIQEVFFRLKPPVISTLGEISLSILLLLVFFVGLWRVKVFPK